MSALPVIPTPAARRWLKFRRQVIPAIVFAVTVGMMVVVWHGSKGVPRETLAFEGAEGGSGLLAARSEHPSKTGHPREEKRGHELELAAETQ